MEPTSCGNDSVASGTSLDENCQLNGLNGDECSLLITEEGHQEQPTEVFQKPASDVSDIPDSDLSPGITDSLSNDTDSKREQKCEGAPVSYTHLTLPTILRV